MDELWPEPGEALLGYLDSFCACNENYCGGFMQHGGTHLKHSEDVRNCIPKTIDGCRSIRSPSTNVHDPTGIGRPAEVKRARPRDRVRKIIEHTSSIHREQTIQVRRRE